MKIKNQTADDARARLLRAKAESLAHQPSVEYLRTLRDGISQWAEIVEMELIGRIEAEGRKRIWDALEGEQS